MIVVLRIGHRKNRDKRVTTHVGLVARAFGAEGFILSGEEDQKIIETLKKVNQKFGQGLRILKYTKNYIKEIKDYKKRNFRIVHLTMYGEPINEKIDLLRGFKNLMVIVGAEKVPREVYQISDYNISVTNQPHSEVGALAVFLHEYFDGRELAKEFKKASIKIIPSKKGKNVVNISKEAKQQNSKASPQKIKK